MQRALIDDARGEEGIRVRIGAHVGTSVRRGDDLFGLDVAMAARVADLAEGGEILVSDALRQGCRRAVRHRVRQPPRRTAEGAPGTQRVYAVDVQHLV